VPVSGNVHLDQQREVALIQ